MSVSHRVFSAAARPACPLCSRFVAPWDTSGWYFIAPDCSVGSKVYSNRDVTVSSLPARYEGADIAVTFDSVADGFEDKQEIDFFAERPVTVGVALDSSMEETGYPAWTATYVCTEDRVILSDGTSYRLFEKTFESGEHVHVDAFEGEAFHQFFALIAPASKDEAPAPLPSTPKCASYPAPYVGRTYRIYANEVFNRPELPEGLETVGEVSVRFREDDEKDGYVAVTGGCIIKAIPDFGKRVVVRAKVTPFESAGQYLTCAVYSPRGVVACIALHGGEAFAASREESVSLGSFKAGEDLSLRLVFDREKGEFDVWRDCRLLASGIPVSDTDIVGVKFIAHTGTLGVDNLRIEDDPEVYAVNETFETMPACITKQNADLSVVPYPFPEDPSLLLRPEAGEEGAFAYAFPAMSGVCTVETKVKASDGGFVLAPELTDETGVPALRIALYKNNVYATNGMNWERLYGGENEWMYYPCANWLALKITVNLTEKTYDLMIDGAVRARGFALMNPVASLCRLAFTAEKETNLRVNRIRIYDAPDFCRLSPAGPVFDVRAYGAVGDGKTLDTKAIQEAIDAAAYTGGSVLLSGGTFFSGELFLRSDMTLYVDRTARLLGTRDHGQYPLQEPGTSLCAVRQLGRGLVFGEGVHNVTVTGGGTLDGNGTYRFKMNDPYPDKRVQDARPDIVYITYSKDVTVEYLNLKNSAFWTVVPLSCGNVLFRFLNLDCMNTPNRDGIDPVDSHDMTIYGCNIMAGDDGLCFKSSDPVGCYHIEVHDMMIQSLASGIKFGTDTYYALRDAHVSDCTVKNVNRCGISLETVDGAAVEDVTFERIDMTDVGAPVYVTVGARNRLPRGGAPVRRSYINGVTFRSLRFDRAYPFSYTKNIREVMAVGQSSEQRIENVTFEDCDFTLAGGFAETPGCPRVIENRYPEYDRHGLSAGHAFTVRYAKNFRVKNVKITLENPDVRPMIAEFDTEK